MPKYPIMEELLVQPTITSTPAIIKVVGVGGGGGNAAAEMYREGIAGVRIMVCNSDAKALEDNIIPDKLQLGPGLGCGGNPVIGKEMAEENLDDIRKIFDESTQMLFITAGMGGGTGTGVSPVIAREARARGILTIGIVTLPFLFEREKQIDKALDGMEALAAEVDAILVINNERLRDIYTDLTICNAFKKADETLTVAVKSIVEIITSHGKIGLDFRDAFNVLKGGGVAIMSTGYGEGPKRVTEAIRNALYSPLLNKKDIYRSKKILISITASDDPEKTLRMEEMEEVNSFMAKFNPLIETKWGLAFDEGMENKVKFTILASGFHLSNADDELPVSGDGPEDEKKRIMREEAYPELRNRKKTGRSVCRPRIFLYSSEDLENEQLTEALESKPTATRSYEDFQHIQSLRENRTEP